MHLTLVKRLDHLRYLRKRHVSANQHDCFGKFGEEQLEQSIRTGGETRGVCAHDRVTEIGKGALHRAQPARGALEGGRPEDQDDLRAAAANQASGVVVGAVAEVTCGSEDALAYRLSDTHTRPRVEYARDG